MKERDEFRAAPVAPVQHAFAAKIERAGDVARASARQDEHDLLAHALADTAEEVAGEIGPAPCSPAGIHVKGEERVPMRFGDVAAAEPFEIDAFGEHRGAFLTQILALGGRQLGEKFVETPVAAIVPMERLVVALQEAERAGGFPFLPGEESNVE